MQAHPIAKSHLWIDIKYPLDLIVLAFYIATVPNQKYRHINLRHFSISYGDTSEIALSFFFGLTLQVLVESGLPLL